LLSEFYRWSAWYSGDVDQLTAAYGATPIAQQLNRPAQFSGGLRGVMGRVIWGNPIEQGSDDDRLHVPLASDLCAATAELLYSEPPTITTTNTAANDRVNEYIRDGLLTSMAGGVEIGAALGGRYVQAVIPAGGTRARFEQVAYDGAWPVFTCGELRSVAFWWELGATQTGGMVWRHFESHDLDPTGVGVIRHGLYRGTRDKVGQRMDLTAHPDLAELAAAFPDGVVDTGTPGLDVVHIPGRQPQRLWRTKEIGKDLGRSVFQGVEGALSKLDDAYSSWMRDVDLGRSRLIVADWLLETGGKPGMGAMFDLDRRLITPLAMPRALGTDSASDPIRQIQFAIRVEEHRATCQELTEVILRAASFSANTFGEDENGNAQTATGVISKDSRSMRTRDAVLNNERPALETILRKALSMDQKAGLGPVADDALTVEFTGGAQETPLQVAGTLQALRAAEAASDLTIVGMLHPDWTVEQVAEEVRLIREGAAARANLDATTATMDLGGTDAGITG
jgi:A118 family predicted phage portal protein